MVLFNREAIPRWHRKTSTDDSVIYTLEIRDNLKKTLIEPFVGDFEEWDENVTNRSYLHWEGAGGGFIFCSKVMFRSDSVEIRHTVFRSYNKNTPFFYLKEQAEDDYKMRVQVNCDWFEKQRCRINWKYFEEYSHRGRKVFNCNGRLITIFPISPL
jgi:uncharacterized protein YihD (DUF1040 family)